MASTKLMHHLNALSCIGSDVKAYARDARQCIELGNVQTAREILADLAASIRTAQLDVDAAAGELARMRTENKK